MLATELCAGSFLRRTVTYVLASQPVPKHIAIIMDGNRRYAERHLRSSLEGHTQGYTRLIDALEWCLQLGVKCVSVYAFSIDNYKRTAEEVTTLMKLAEEKLAAMLEEQDVLHRHSVQVRVIGDLTLAPLSVQRAAERIMSATWLNKGAILNICFSYTASREMQHALEAGKNSGGSLDDYLYTHDCPPVDLLIRTSGECRMSDFMLRQSSHALLVFTHILWPDFSFLDLASAVIKYQRHHVRLDVARGFSQRALAAVTNSASSPGAHKATIEPMILASIDSNAFSGQLKPVKVRVEVGASDSPCGIATPGSASSPSVRSDGSDGLIAEPQNAACFHHCHRDMEGKLRKRQHAMAS